MDTSDRILLALGDIKEDIGALGADVRSLDRRLGDIEQTVKAHIEKTSKRLSDLEHAQTRARTITAVIAAVASSAITLGAAILKGIPWAPHS